jgi:transglutaminase-like putative cysteine protease
MPADWQSGIDILGGSTCVDSEMIDRTSIGNETWIQWSGPSDLKLARLRSEYSLDSIEAGVKTELDRLCRLRDWVHDRFAHHSHNVPAVFDSLHILEKAQHGERFRCVEYSFILADVYRAMGWPARLVRLEGRSGAHVVTEVFSQELDKWLVMDGQHAAHVLLGGRPIDVFEFREAVVTRRGSELAPQLADGTLDYVAWNAGYLEYLMYAQDLSFGNQLSSLLVLAPPGDPGPATKPDYLKEHGTAYVLVHNRVDVYPREVPPIA